MWHSSAQPYISCCSRYSDLLELIQLKNHNGLKNHNVINILFEFFEDIHTDIQTYLPGDPKKSVPLFRVSGGTWVFAKQQYRHIFIFPIKKLTISDQYFQRFHCKKKYICNCAVFIQTAQLQMSFGEIILRHPEDVSLIGTRISHRLQYFEGFSYIHY